jgi:glycogen debranching enzyme
LLHKTPETATPDLYLSIADNELAAQAADVLEANWMGQATMPSPSLYPHQWSWDSACIAIGYSRWNQERAEQELRSLFAGQWRNGLLPHIVFTDGAAYFPGPDFWQTERSPDAPDVRTSGIVQPPVHATAALAVYRHALDRDTAEAFAAELQPKLAAWHDYLYRERDRSGNGLVELWHPWESGMDNSPLWDAALERIDVSNGRIPEYERVDDKVAAPAERPTKDEYDRYAYLVALYRDCDYAPELIRQTSPFVLQDVLFNSLLVQANRDLAELTRAVGGDPQPHEERAELTAAAIDAELWDDGQAAYLDRDVRENAMVAVRVGAACAPLYAGVPSPERAACMVESQRSLVVDLQPIGHGIASFGVDEPGFDAARYWRGPMWPMVNWVAHRGLRRYGYTVEAAAIRNAFVGLARREGFWEHYNPLNGRGQGGKQFAWTAGLILDLLADKEAAV